MSTFRPPVSRSEAERIADEYIALTNQLYRQRLTAHPFMRSLQGGSISNGQLRMFIKNWYTFALEVNTAASTLYHRFISFYKTHPEMEDLVTATISEEFSEPGPGGHIRIM